MRDESQIVQGLNLRRERPQSSVTLRLIPPLIYLSLSRDLNLPFLRCLNTHLSTHPSHRVSLCYQMHALKRHHPCSGAKIHVSQWISHNVSWQVSESTLAVLTYFGLASTIKCTNMHKTHSFVYSLSVLILKYTLSWVLYLISIFVFILLHTNFTPLHLSDTYSFCYFADYDIIQNIQHTAID